jgi:hypothetical protein
MTIDLVILLDKSRTLSHYRPGQALKEVVAARIYRQSAHEGGKVVSPSQGPHLPPPEYIPGTHFC